MMIIIGIDPGVTGGIAYLQQDGTILAAEDIPVAGGEVDVDALVRKVRAFAPRLAVIEKAQAMPRQGVSSTFKYGTAYGSLRAVTALCEIETHLVSPRKWKAHFKLVSDKERSRALAIRLWPGTGLFERKKHHGRAEAALLARYGAEVLDRGWRSLKASGPMSAKHRAAFQGACVDREINRCKAITRRVG